MTTNIADQQQREQALNTKHSYIVQAPAGSGKTELLTQRYLILLSQVSEPEEIIALTFTKKAAAEMRERILQAIHKAASGSKAQQSHQQTTLALANAVLKQDKKFAWQLLNNPNRLRIVTIDSLCAYLTHQLPILSGLGAQPQTIDNAADFYKKAVDDILADIENEHPWSASLRNLLSHLDCNLGQLENLLVGMLEKRDQWLPYLMTYYNDIDDENKQAELKQRLQQGLVNIAQDQLQKIEKNFPQQYVDELLELSRFAAANLLAANAESPVTRCEQFTQLPAYQLTNLTDWQALANLLLTKDYQWRKAVTKQCGFPAPSGSKDKNEKALFKDYKDRMQELLLQLQEHETLRLALEELLLCPPINYSQQQWQILLALLKVLPIVVAQLDVLFAEQGVADFTAIALSANKALQENHNPTDLALALDHQIKHLLVDEFQDTSLTQFRLLEHLTAGWEENDGRTLFLVGDPMQSIYRFRQAEVGLFLRAKQQGIGDVKLKPLTLSVNFRSQQAIVDGINNLFPTIMPSANDISLGAVSFVASQAINPTQGNQSGIHCYALCNDDGQQQADIIINIIKENQQTDNQQTIAVLVRRKTDLVDIIAALKHEEIAYQAVEIDKLYKRPVIQDLMALTSALLHFADRIAWLAILRAPWCGLTLADLHIIAQQAKQQTIWQRINDSQVVEQLSVSGRKKISALVNTLQSIFAASGNYQLREMVELSWLKLGGPACLQQASALNDVDAFFEFIGSLNYPDNSDTLLIKEKLLRLFSNVSPQSGNAIELMTIHKAKGLEFDTVILPALHGKPILHQHNLLLWMERAREYSSEKSDLILAPIKASHEKQDEVYQYLNKIEQLKGRYEISRLLYVAMTRAKQSLHLLANVNMNQNDEIRPPYADSFLGMLWSATETKFIDNMTDNPSIEDNMGNNSTKLSRLAENWQPPVIRLDKQYYVDDKPIKFANLPVEDDNKQRLLGTFIHRLLQQIALQGSKQWRQPSTNNNQHWRTTLQHLGIATDQLDMAVSTVVSAIEKATTDNKVQWIFDNQYSVNLCEYPLTGYINNELTHIIIDRMFIDNDNIRWIIDYKTTTDITNDKLADYQQQLKKYATIVKQWDDKHPIKTGIYFPLTGDWYSWQA